MEMKSAAPCEVSYGGEIERIESSSTLTEIMKGKESTKYAMSDNDSLCDIEICEVIGNVRDLGENTLGIKKECGNYMKSGICEASAVSESEGLLRGESQKETFTNGKDNDIVNFTRVNEGGSNANKNGNGLVLLQNDSQENIYSVGNMGQNGIAVQSSGDRPISNSPGLLINARLNAIENVKDGDLLLDDGNEIPISNIYSPASRIIHINSEDVENELINNEVSPMKEVSNDVAVQEVSTAKVVESYQNDKDANDEIFIAEEENKENRGNDESQSSNVKVRREENMRGCNGDQDIIVSLGSTWDSEVQLRSEFYTSDENNVDGNLISEVNVDESDTLLFAKNFEGEKMEENGKASETHGGKIMQLEEEVTKVAKSAVGNGGIVSCLEEDEVEEGGKRKRIQKGEETVELNVKKRKIENNKNEPNGCSVGEPDDAVKADAKRNVGRKSDTSVKSDQSSLEESIDRVASANVSLPFLESLRGSIKTLSRGDLEELIVQKLCEVINERSTVGHLRKKAEALEKNQERWKEKVHSLTKQIKEMDMVMKRYLSEVRRQSSEGNFHMVTPLRVTRSVGLQVSFTNITKYSGKDECETNNDKYQMADKSFKAVKHPLLHAACTSQIRKKNVPILSTTPVKKPAFDMKNKFSQRPGVNLTFQARLITPETLMAAKRALQVQQTNRPRLPAPDRNNSNLIDLTDDDDRQTQQNSQNVNSQITNGQNVNSQNGHNQNVNGQNVVLQPSVTVRPPSQIRVVNHIQPAQVNPRVAYLLPTASTSTSTSSSSTSSSSSSGSSQSRQLLIATPTVQPAPRHILPSVPPLLYKGSTLVQPGSQPPNFASPSRTFIAKAFKHPAPLPQPPLNQIQKPNWKLLPPRPALKISRVQTGIVLSWNMTLGPEYEPIASYQLYAYQENNCPPTTSLWKKVGDVKALPLPMACTLTQFISGHKYYFAVRAVDLHSRIGPFSFPGSIVLVK